MQLLTIPRAARELGISRWTLGRAADAGEIPSLRRGSRRYVCLEQIAATMLGRLRAEAAR